MKFINTVMIVCSVLLFCSVYAQGAETSLENSVNRFIKVVRSNDRKDIAGLVAYPLRREVPLSSINNQAQFLANFDEVLDDELLKAVATSRISDDWSEMGWRGIMFRNGSLWLDEEGKITAVNYQTEQGKRKRAELIEADRNKLHVSLRDFVAPVLEWETAGYRIRIDQLGDNRFRYAVWPVQKKSSETPDLVLKNGTVSYDGSGGNHSYDFKSGDTVYRCSVWVIGVSDTSPGELSVNKKGKLLLSQPVLKVITGR